MGLDFAQVTDYAGLSAAIDTIKGSINWSKVDLVMELLDTADHLPTSQVTEMRAYWSHTLPCELQRGKDASDFASVLRSIDEKVQRQHVNGCIYVPLLPYSCVRFQS